MRAAFPSNPQLRRRKIAERIGLASLRVAALATLVITAAIVATLFTEALQFFKAVPLKDFFFGSKWAPIGGSVEAGDYGVRPLLTGSFMIVVGALVVGLPLGIMTAVFLAEYASDRVRRMLKPILELLAGIPTVVVGFFALQVITPDVLRSIFGQDRVFIFNAAAGAIAVGIIVLPTIASVCEDAISAVPNSLREASLAMGAGKRTTVLRVVLPAAVSGISAAFILAVSRALGETMAVSIAAGNSPTNSFNFFKSIQTLTAFISQTVSGETAAGTVRYYALFAVGALLFVLTLSLNLVSNAIVKRYRHE